MKKNVKRIFQIQKLWVVLILPMLVGSCREKEYEFTFDKEDTLKDIMNEINNDDDLGVTMSYNKTTGKFTLTTDKVGADEKLVLEDTNGSNFFESIGLTDAGADRTEGCDTMATVDGIEVVRASKTFTVDGVTYQANEVTAPGEEININKINNEQKMTEAPAPYTEAKIVKLMEDKKIGRPSTYASTIATLLKREYVASKSGSLTSTEVGQRTTTVLHKYFPDFVDVKYTAQMEEKLDQIQEGEVSRTEALTEFYYPFIKSVEDASAKMYKDDDEPVGRNCPICGAPLVYKKSKYGNFIGCSNFPTCDYTDNIKVKANGSLCPMCGSELLVRQSRKHKNKPFYVCDKTKNPDCEFITWDLPVNDKKCETCGSYMVWKNFRGKKYCRCANKDCATNAKKTKS